MAGSFNSEQLIGLFALIMNVPQILPCFSAVLGTLPIPVQRVLCDVPEHHSGDEGFAVALSRFGPQFHLAIVELTRDSCCSKRILLEIIKLFPHV